MPTVVSKSPVSLLTKSPVLSEETVGVLMGTRFMIVTVPMNGR